MYVYTGKCRECGSQGWEQHTFLMGVQAVCCSKCGHAFVLTKELQAFLDRGLPEASISEKVTVTEDDEAVRKNPRLAPTQQS